MSPRSARAGSASDRRQRKPRARSPIDTGPPPRRHREIACARRAPRQMKATGARSRLSSQRSPRVSAACRRSAGARAAVEATCGSRARSSLNPASTYARSATRIRRWPRSLGARDEKGRKPPSGVAALSSFRGSRHSSASSSPSLSPRFVAALPAIARASAVMSMPAAASSRSTLASCARADSATVAVISWVVIVMITGSTGGRR